MYYFFLIYNIYIGNLDLYKLGRLYLLLYGFDKEGIFIKDQIEEEINNGM